MRDLTFDGEVLRDKEGQPVHAIWRRCVTNDVLEFWDESQALIEAVKAQKVALIGSFAGHIVHDKQIFEALFNPATQAFLTPEEIAFVERTVPQTALSGREGGRPRRRPRRQGRLDHQAHRRLRRGRRVRGLLPNAGAMGTDHREVRQRGRRRPLLGAALHHAVQDARSLTPDDGIADMADDQVQREPVLYNNLEGLYCYNGTFQGIFSRLGPFPTISKPMKGITCATIWVD